VPRWIAIPCNVIAAVALVPLAFDPDGNLALALALLIPAAVALYGMTVLVKVRKR
jgi:hypothetical protein